MTEQSEMRGETTEDGPPPFDPVLVGAVAKHIELDEIVLVALHYDDTEAQSPILMADSVARSTPSVELAVRWEFNRLASEFGCLVTTTLSLPNESPNDDEDPGLYIEATYRAQYSVAEQSDDLTEAHFSQFAHWNVVFNVWPFWRELAASILQRSRHTPYLVPVFRMPRKT